MRDFFKFIFASCLGTILAVGVIFLFFLSFTLSSAPQETISSGSTLHITLNEIIPELGDNIENGGFAISELKNVGLNEIKEHLAHAAQDNKVNGILIETEMPNVGQATALSIYNSIKEFKQSGKPVMAYGEYFSQTGYLLASLADSVILNPNGMMDIRGYGVLIPYFAEMIDKIDAKVDVYFAGQYKSAIEPYYRSSSSSQNDYQTEEFLNDWQDLWLDLITENRGIDRKTLSDIIENGTIVTAEIALESGLCDALAYRSDFDGSFSDQLDRKKLKLVDLDQYVTLTEVDEKSSSNKVAVVYMEGTIMNNNEDKGVISMDTYKKVFDRLASRKSVKAVVLRVNSGGGDALESDIIWDRVEELKKAGKYVVASFGDYAASGGYYISCGADQIVSMPNTLTGSIGVFAMIPDLSQTFANNLGIRFDSIGTGENTFMYSPMVPRNKAQNQKIQANTEQTYQKFLSRVAEGRGKSVEEIHQVAQGRVWSGEDAVEAGLVDEIGDLDKAIEIAAEGAELDNYQVYSYPIIERSFYEELLYSLGDLENVKAALQIKTPKILNPEILDMVEMVSEHQLAKPQCRLPFMVEIN